MQIDLEDTIWWFWANKIFTNIWRIAFTSGELDRVYGERTLQNRLFIFMKTLYLFWLLVSQLHAWPIFATS